MKLIAPDYWQMGRIDMIKLVRMSSELGLKESKDAVERYLVEESLNYADRNALSRMAEQCAVQGSWYKKALAKYLNMELKEY